MPAKLYINLNNLKHNINKVKEKLYSNQELLVMVKADAYGAGLIDVTRFLESEGISHFGVAYLKEAIELRENGIKSDITIFSGLLPNEIHIAVLTDAIYSVSDIVILELLNKEAIKYNKKVRVELAIDTGMTRLGFEYDNIDLLINKLESFSNIEVNGIYTHFSSADSNEEFTKGQIDLFDKCINKLKLNGVTSKYIHACNSAGVMKYNDKKYNIVRLGICAYGYYPNNDMKDIISIKGVFKFVAPICNIKEVEKDRYVSYNRKYITKEKTKIAVLQIGYADGLTRALSNKYDVLVNGKKSKIIGNICMDTCMINVTGIDVNVGDEVVIFDYNDGKVDEIANMTDTIVYEIITNIGKRVRREYVIE